MTASKAVIDISAIRILQQAARQVARSGEPGSRMNLTTLYNAVFYLLTGRIDGSRATAGFWASLPVGDSK